MRIFQLFYGFLVVLATFFLAHGVDGVDASEKPAQTMSTGETPTAFVKNKIDSHDVSRHMAESECWKPNESTL